MKKLFTLISLTLLSVSALGQNTKSVETTEARALKDAKLKPRFTFSGRVEARFIYNSYNSKDSRDGVLYYYPLAPSYDKGGSDLNSENSLNFSVFSTRLSFLVDNIRVLGADMNAYVETDFLGSSDNYLQLLRLRQAYINFKWKNDRLLLGQTTSLTYMEDIAPATVMFNGGLPFNTLNRGAQIRYTRYFSPIIYWDFAAEIYTAHKSVGPSNAQTKAAIPDLHTRLVFGDAKKIIGGVTFGYKFFKPRSVDNSGYKVSTIVPSYDVSAFLAFTIDDYKFKIWGIYGQNLTPYCMIGGYGKVLGDNASGDYKYSNINTFSGWFDFETPLYKGFQFGLFAGYQTSLGANKDVDLTRSDNGDFAYGYYRDANLAWFSRVSPRVYYHASKKFAFGLEYSYASSSWAQTVEPNFRALTSYPTTNDNRVELLARFSF